MIPDVIAPPKPGVAVLACRCGKVLDLADMHREPRLQGHSTPVRPIVCVDCAAGALARAGRS